MKAKLGNEIVEYWQISLTKPANESWVLEAFKKGQLSWSGQFTMNKETKEKLLSDGMSTKNPAEHDTLSKEIKHLDWLGLYISPNKLSNAYPDNVYLVVNQVRIPAFGRLGEYLLVAPDGSFEIYSEKKFQRDLEKIQ
ncbi:hypothetical protein LMG8520_0252 [Lactococcus lactis subsp. lactis]|uniref:Uncharacterized protein n=2 Tax=Lactococcus lactis TaxID=1358 RepID=A0A2A5SK02_LACLH|nr:hypothetical protein [Lactococcus lactis]KAA8704437.1 hypothetical protein F4V48_02310 [Lactococcus lactis subsp. hordniae]KSU14601.1 hypothetical protein LMG8520_0252 [Lactococcus lactis subsp. lactis]MCT3134033.1 hypothetical protein [Lactococcus lactis]PCS13799.1 hypothetical protein RU90_GL001764 [Lactococcus lactis subsp. hordniae]